MFQNWPKPPADEFLTEVLYSKVLPCGNGHMQCTIHGMFGSMVFGGDATVYHRATLNGRPVNLDDFSKLFHEYEMEEIGCIRMIESVKRCYKSLVLTLKPCVGDSDSPPGKQLHVVMQQLDLKYTPDGRIDWRDTFQRLKAASVEDGAEEYV
jgi:hypothetical protein